MIMALLATIALGIVGSYLTMRIDEWLHVRRITGRRK